jgi:MFS family permease
MASAAFDQPAPAQPWHAGLTPTHWRILTASFLGWIFDGYEAFALILVLPAALKALLPPEQLATAPFWAGIAISSTLLGWGLGGMAGGIMADYVGRKRMMMLSVFFYALFAGLTAFSTSFAMLAGLRFLTGLAMGSEWSTGVALVAETWPDRARPKGCGFLQSGFGWGTLLAAVIWLVLARLDPLGPDTWRLMFLVGAIPALFVLYIRRAVNESERWLAALREKRWATTEEDARHARAPVGAARRPFTLAEIFREPEGRRRVLLAFLLSLATTVGWWAISSWLPIYTTGLARAANYPTPEIWGQWAALVYTIGAVIAYLLSGFIADAIGRRLFLFCTFAGALVMTPVTYLWTKSPELMLVVAGVNGFFTLGCAYSWMAIYLAELFTSSVRSTASSFVFNAARLIAWVFPIIAGTMISSFGGIPRAAMVLGSIYVLGLIVPWFMPETRGKPLPE